MYRCILIPTDGSEFCERAIRHGVNLATLAQAKIIGLTVTQPLHTGNATRPDPGQHRRHHSRGNREARDRKTRLH